MPSRADGRRVGEWTLRVAMIAMLAVALWRSLRAEPADAIRRESGARGAARALRDATTDTRVSALDLTLDTAPSRVERDWLRALRRAGVPVMWGGAPAAIAIEAERTREPAPRVRISLAGASGVIAISDSAGALDSASVSEGGAMFESPAVVGDVRASAGRSHARASLPASRTPRAVLVLGRAGWENKFVSAALQESGWTVRARATVAPGVVITDPALLPLDTARYDAVVALDSTADALAGDIARFVRSGGGLVLAGDAPSLAGLRALAPARTGARRPGRILLDGDTVTRGDLPLRPLEALRADAVRLEGTSALPLVAVRRAALGRVAVVSYDESWRWRMLGGESGAKSHRTWWSRTVALVSPAAPAAVASAASDPAPVAALVDALGAPDSAGVAPAGREPSRPLPLAMLGLIALALLAEVASRRFRGAR